MLHVSYFTSNTFSGTHNQIMTPPLASMGHNISIDYSCAPNKLLSMELCPLEVKLVPKFYPHCFGCNFLIRALFCEPFSSLDSSLQVILFELQRDKCTLVHSILMGFDWLKTSFRASKMPRKLMTFKNHKNSHKTDCFTTITTFKS
jgi:hypothetical protein